MDDEQLEPGPSRYAVRVQCLSPTGLPVGTASGFLVQSGGSLYAVTNWHVVTGGRIHRSPPELQERCSQHGPEPLRWVTGVTIESTPHAATLTAHIYGWSRQIAVLALEVTDPPDFPAGTYRAWEPLSLFDGTDTEPWMPTADVAVLKVTDDLDQLRSSLAELIPQRQRRLDTLGYRLDQMGEEADLRLGDPVYVVGYPLNVGSRPSDPPVWTGGTVATDPRRPYAGDRFLIDARTRQGQSGSAVIAYHPGGRGLRPNWQLLGIYSGRIHPDADIGSVWLASQLRTLISSPDRQFVTLNPPTFEAAPDTGR